MEKAILLRVVIYLICYFECNCNESKSCSFCKNKNVSTTCIFFNQLHYSIVEINFEIEVSLNKEMFVVNVSATVGI
jgi:hypothetical protein